MTDREVRKRLVWVSVVFVSALTFAASYLVVTDVDRPRRKASVDVPALGARFGSGGPPVQGLVPAASAQRRVVAVRRTRAS